jgi:hypothetical protein
MLREVPANLSVSDWINNVREAKRWHFLVLEDTENWEYYAGNRISGQFTPQDVSHQIGSSVPEAGGFARANPLVQWVGGKIETLSFQARLFSEHRDDYSAENKLEILKFLCKPIAPLGRPPLTRFFWGRALPGGMQCLVEDLGGISYDEIRLDGSIRGVTLNITIKKFTDFRVERISLSPAERTPHHVVKHGETYEMIAYRKWGDPMLGVPLRIQNQRYPMVESAPKGIADLVAGEVIKLFPRKDLESTPAKPQSHILDEDNMLSADNRRYFFTQRSKLTTVLPKR